MHDALLFLADLPGCPDIREEAFKVLQLLPTCPSIPEDLCQALQQGPDGAFTSLMSLLVHPGQAFRPSRLLYSLQVCFRIRIYSNISDVTSDM